jgi:hypothetical protein
VRRVLLDPLSAEQVEQLRVISEAILGREVSPPRGG